jgi:hypothetical protein
MRHPCLLTASAILLLLGACSATRQSPNASSGAGVNSQNPNTEVTRIKHVAVGGDLPPPVAMQAAPQTATVTPSVRPATAPVAAPRSLDPGLNQALAQVNAPAPSKPVPTNVSAAPPATVTPVAAQASLPPFHFPTSSARPVGEPWRTQHPNGFLGDVDVMCRLFGYTGANAKACQEYKEQMATGKCWEAELPNGVVFDDLLFTKNGKHVVDHNVLVDLREPVISRKTRLCRVGNDIVALILGCGNYGRIKAVPPQAALPLRTVATNQCQVGVSQDTLRIQVLDWLTMPADIRLRAKPILQREWRERLAGKTTTSAAFSPSFNVELRTRQRAPRNEFPLSQKPYTARVSTLEYWADNKMTLKDLGTFEVPPGQLKEVPMSPMDSRKKTLVVEFLTPVSHPPKATSVGGLPVFFVFAASWEPDDCKLNVWAIDGIIIDQFGQIYLDEKGNIPLS